MLSNRKLASPPEKDKIISLCLTILLILINVLISIKVTENLNLLSSKHSLSYETKFVINPIIYAPEREFDSDSSSEEEDGTFPHANFNFDLKNKNSFPFTTTPKPARLPDRSKARRKTTKERKRSRKKAIKFSKDLPISNQSNSNSIIINPFLEKLSQNGFEDEDKDKLTTSISTCIALNRMKSLSTRKNKSLDLELNSKVETDIRYEKFGFFWTPEWYDKKGSSVEQKTVRKFYKQLKKINRKKAQKFREMEEKNIDVPYQDLRDHAKQHQKTKKLVNDFRENCPGAIVYLSLIDSDTVDFNGIYSAYLRIVNNCYAKKKVVPTVMSTGYEYPEDEPPYHYASEFDRMIRVITAFHIPLGVYYPEPNTCIFIEEESSTVQENFIDEPRIKYNLESPCLLKKIKKRENATIIFSKDKPLITTIPDRARRQNKRSKSKITFSPELWQGASPTKKDITQFKQVTQSSSNKYVWITNLFINDGIEFKKYDLKDYVDDKNLQYCEKLLAKAKRSETRSSAVDELKQHIPSEVVDVMNKKWILQRCKHLISNIRGLEEIATDRSEAINELRKYVTPVVVDAIVKAAEEVNQYIVQFKLDYVRSRNEKKLIHILKKYNIKISSFSRDELQMLAQQPVLEFVKKKIINLQDLIGLDIEVLEYICYDEEIIEMLKNKTIDFDSLLNLLKNNFSEYMVAKEKYLIKNILDKFKENPLHLKFMAGDPTAIVYKNFDNTEIINLGIENCYIEEELLHRITRELNASREHRYYDSAAAMDCTKKRKNDESSLFKISFHEFIGLFTTAIIIILLVFMYLVVEKNFPIPVPLRKVLESLSLYIYENKNLQKKKKKQKL